MISFKASVVMICQVIWHGETCRKIDRDGERKQTKVSNIKQRNDSNCPEISKSVTKLLEVKKGTQAGRERIASCCRVWDMDLCDHRFLSYHRQLLTGTSENKDKQTPNLITGMVLWERILWFNVKKSLSKEQKPANWEISRTIFIHRNPDEAEWSYF